MASSTNCPVEQWPQEGKVKSLLTERQDSDGDVLWPLALLVDEVPCHGLLPLSHPAVVLATVLKAEAVDLQHKNVVAFFGYLELAQGLTLGKLVVEHRHGVGPQAGDEGAVEGPGDGEVAIRDVLRLQDAPKLHRLTHDVRPLLRLQSHAELLIWGRDRPTHVSVAKPTGTASTSRARYLLCAVHIPRMCASAGGGARGWLLLREPDRPRCRRASLLPSMHELQGLPSLSPLPRPLLPGAALLRHQHPAALWDASWSPALLTPCSAVVKRQGLWG